MIKGYNISKVTPKLWQGARPPQGYALRDLGVDVLVLAAHEHQPESERFPGVEVIHCPLHDQLDQSLEDMARIILVGHEVQKRLARGKTVLSTCHMGLNRSGVLSALGLCGLGMPPNVAIATVRKARGPMALSNKTFETIVRSYPKK